MDNPKENGMETTTIACLYRGYIGIMGNHMENQMEKKSRLLLLPVYICVIFPCNDKNAAPPSRQ